MKLKPFRLLSLCFTTKPIPSIFHFTPQRCFRFSTSLTPKSSRLPNFFDDDVSDSSAVYRHAIKFQRPAIIQWSPQQENRASFIGTVMREPKIVNSKTGKFGVYTVLKVQRSNEPNSSSFKVDLMMWKQMAELALEHLKLNDFIYVSGCLGSFKRPHATGNFIMNYKLVVKELHFVAQEIAYKGHKKLESTEADVGIQNHQNRIYLWQVFFVNPNEWWDNRKRKLNPKQPDFKHKNTSEALWLSKYDPPWVKKQLQLLDSKIAEAGPIGRQSRVSTWVYDE
ncbi:hypothetical protein Lal_00010127 [Lupinus albus]|uniref:Putative primosome PriB/single-strand DNA-binding protein n=1 Tax=Lupinus albus TaxID=3870 RepID=A0A6A5LII1_LUPAL|nr:putative primosome PriB/single-strand DNA-binding protein [Lupinus albus]KAF1859543.1 hypothetical protein Lal_00010127 [Lupinus albus]